MLWKLCNAAIRAAHAVPLRRNLLGAVGMAAMAVVILAGSGAMRPACATLLLDAPDGQRIVPAPVDEPASEPLLLARDAQARAVQLTQDDADRYTRIFALQDHADWAGADAEIARLTDRRLLGYVLRQRYLHPDRKASFDELAQWMHKYGDLAGADRVHALAQRRQPAGDRSLRPPRGEESVRLTGALEQLGGLRTVSARADAAGEEASSPTDGPDGVSIAPRSRTVSRPRADRIAVARVDDLVRAGRAGAALALLGQDEFSRSLDSAQYDAARTRIAASLFYNGEVTQALALASASAARSGDAVPEAHWIAGLAAWRLKQHDRAARHFDGMAAAEPSSPWLAAAADYWAARAHTRRGRAAEALAHLTAAARYPHTFYGLLARQALGGVNALEWRGPDLTGAHLAALARKPAGARAIALLQTGQRDLAELELQRVHPQGNPLVEQALVSLADRAGLPTLSLRLGNAVAGPDGSAYAAALYPLPHWRPRDGFTLDPALVFAVMRQESRFDPRLVSSAGATGLMQILPSTAQHVQERNPDLTNADADRAALVDPARNMELGQRYLAELLAMPDIGGNLFLATAAYNAGPGTLLRWRREMNDVADPLLFIESLPFAETRDYVEKVMANYWIYRLRMGQDSASLAAVAAGKWPVYAAPAVAALSPAVPSPTVPVSAPDPRPIPVAAQVVEQVAEQSAGSPID
ncbi:lytic transglycosylase domain-containing protein [Azospirillum griseum]|uniref:Lytic transglycosylase domain-containing protein n=2 Tax=Azospirillum griseum TaxID=2496639 RepID=A0A431VM08_9PROT|nr:lytic transglycosylase domain-containing protein [Azospirillum griseum]